MQRKTMQGLTTAVLLSCSCLLAPYYAQAEAVTPPEGAHAGETVEKHKENFWEVRLPEASGANRPYAIFDVYDKTNDPAGYWRADYEEEKGEAGDEADKKSSAVAAAADEEPAQGANEPKLVQADFRDFFPGEKAAIADSLQYFSDMLGFAQKENLPLIKLELLPDKDDNAMAESATAIYKDNEGKLTHYITGTMLAEAIQAKDKLPAFANENKYLAEITIDDASKSWYVDKFPILPYNGLDSDYFGTVTHEMFHALGLAAEASNWGTEENPDFKLGTLTQEGESILARTVFNKYEIGLRDVFGRVAYYYTNSDNQRQYADTNPLYSDEEKKIPAGYILESRTLQYITLAEYNAMSKDEIDPDKFYILRDATAASDAQEGEGEENAAAGSSQLKQITGEVGSQGGVYFTGKNVREVLTTNGEVAELAMADGVNNFTVQGGLPLNGYESEDIADAPDLSHIELQNSLMSHQNYRNWCTYMEAELALLQDLGYEIDRSKYFGKSIYNSGTANDRFSVLNKQGFDSSQRHGIGLHVYGSYVDVTQQADIKATGNYGMGIRVDGVGNRVNINSYVSANGEGGNALAVTYGKEHELTLQKEAALVALGKDGVAARFDFGSNELGDMTEYRGSGIDVRYFSKEFLADNLKENPEAAGQAGWIDISLVMPEALKGSLVTDFNVNGTLAGKQAAIYISPNAYVENINIMQGANITGDIISAWNPEAIIYQNEDEVSQAKLCGDNVLKPQLYGKDGLTKLNFGVQADVDGDVLRDNAGKLLVDKNFHLNYSGNIKGTESLVMNVSGGTLSFNGAAEVKSVEVAQEATLKGNAAYAVKTGFVNNGTIAPGNSIGTINIKGDFTNNGVISAEFMGDGTSDKIIVDGNATVNGKIQLTPLADYYSGNTKLQLVENKDGDDSKISDNVSDADITINAVSPVLKMQLVENKEHTGFVISAEREENAYSSCAEDDVTHSLGQTMDKNAASVQGDAQSLVGAIDFAGDRSDISAAMRRLNPAVYSSSAQAILNTHAMLNNLTMLGSASLHEKPDAVRAGGGRGPAASAEPKRNSWRNIVMPFSSYTDQHNGSRDYTNHNSGVLGAMERTLDNDLTLGYHAAVNHQSTSAAGGSVKGEGLYLGTQASYAPDEWQGWSLFGSARLGVEQLRSHRSVAIGSYKGNADADWTGYSGSLRLGAALTQKSGVVKSGSFAALAYSFAHRPSVSEEGGAVRTHLAAATYDSLYTQLGYQLSTEPKLLASYDGTQWQAHFSAAWNHELLGDNGTTSYTLADLPGVTISDTAKNYGRDSLGLLAGVTFRTPKNLDVTLSLGSDIYRQGGSAVYGKVGLEWKF